MNKCRSFRKIISRNLDGDLDPRRRLLLNSHFVTCAQCRSIADDYSKIRGLLHDHFAEPNRNRPLGNTPIGTISTPYSPYHRSRKIYALAALLVLAVVTAAFFTTINRTAAIHTPLIVDTTISSIMNTPLGALMYYETLSGNTINAQFHRFNDTNSLSALKIGATGIAMTGYESPLFGDNISLQQDYGFIATR